MKKMINKKQVVVSSCTVMFVILSVLVLHLGLSYLSTTDIGEVENKLSKNILAKPINTQYVNNDKSLKQQLIESMQEVKKGEIQKSDLKVKNVQEQLYESAKNIINIKKDEAKEIAKLKINNIFSDMLDVANMKLYLLDESVNRSIPYSWWINIADKTNKKVYSCNINAMNGECTELAKFDYTGLENPSDGDIITEIKPKVSNDKINQYVTRAKELVIRNNIINSANNIVEGFSLKKLCYLGLRPTVQVSAKTKNGQTVDATFYIDTDELIGVSLHGE